jgi:hypothetical protein
LQEGRLQDALNHLQEVIASLALEERMSDQDVQLLRRAVCGGYLAAFREQDPAQVQRRTLDELDRGMDRIREGDRSVDCRASYIERMIADAREQAMLAVRERV